MRLGASSFAEMVTLEFAVAEASVIVAETLLATALPIAETWTATVPAPETPIPRARITA
jgi:hypothetical protein